MSIMLMIFLLGILWIIFRDFNILWKNQKRIIKELKKIKSSMLSTDDFIIVPQIIDPNDMKYSEAVERQKKSHLTLVSANDNK